MRGTFCPEKISPPPPCFLPSPFHSYLVNHLIFFFFPLSVFPTPSSSTNTTTLLLCLINYYALTSFPSFPFRSFLFLLTCLSFLPSPPSTPPPLFAFSYRSFFVFLFSFEGQRSFFWWVHSWVRISKHVFIFGFGR